MSRPILWQPNPGPQTKFLASTAYEVLYGGAAGGGKSAALVVMPLRWAALKDFNALILRRETTQLDDLVQKSRGIYPGAVPGAKYRDDKHLWTFPSGARVRFNHCKDLSDAFDYQGQEFQLVGFDELTHFDLPQYLEIISRVRSSTPGLPRYVRATTNPGGRGHEWVFRRWGAWLDPSYEADGLQARRDPETGDRLPPARPGEVLYFQTLPDGSERVVPKGTPGGLSRTFIPARLSDNPRLVENDPEYEARLNARDPVRRRQLKDGDWLVKPAAGLYFKQIWMPVVDAAPAEVLARVRYWDLAGSPDGDWAIGVRMSRTREGLYFVEHVERLRGTPGEVRAAVKATAQIDGTGVPLWIEQDPGQAGKDQVASYVKELPGYTVRGRPKRVDKITAAGPVSSQAQAGNVKVVRGHWNKPFFDVLEAFPDGEHDDDVDGLSGAFAILVGSEPAPYESVRVRSRWA